MTEQTLHLFGRPCLTVGETELPLSSRKGLALAAYLALQPHGRISRATAATLLWPEYNDDRARANLRHLLYGLQKTALAPWFLSEPETIGLNPQAGLVDVTQFRTALDAADWATAVQLYTADFLADFYLPDNEPFADWQRQQQDALQQQMLHALSQQATHVLAAADYETAVSAAQRQIALNPLHEPGWQQYIQALLAANRRSAALTAYNDLCQLLADELGISPSPAITQLLQESPPLTPQSTVVDTAVSTTRSPAQQILLDKVHAFWIDGVLEQSLHQAALIALDMQTAPDALSYPWEMVLQRPYQPRTTLPPHTPIYHIFQQHAHALLILGAPGSGKTTTLLDLARTALEHARQDASQPIPVPFNLSSWAQTQRPLHDWLIDELNEKYLIPPHIGRTWLQQDALLLLLDGLDEVKAECQQACVQAINQFRQAHGFTHCVVCSRLTEYEALAHKLRLETAVILQPLTPVQIDAYLQQGGASLTAVRAAIAQDLTLQEMAQSPLMLSIMALAYQNLPPAALTSDANPESRRHHLFDAYVGQMAQRKGTPLHHSLPQTQRWLAWLARRLQTADQTIFLLEMLQPAWLHGRLQRWLYICTTRLLGGLIIALLISATIPMAVWGLFMGGLCGLFTGFQFDRQTTVGQQTAGVGNGRFRYPLRMGKSLLPPLLLLLTIFLIDLPLNTISERITLLAPLLGLFFIWLPFGLLLEWRDSGRSPSSDIQTVEQLTWSWARARQRTLHGMGWGTAVGAGVGLLVATAVPTDNRWQIALIIIFFFGLPIGLCLGLLNGFTRDVVPLKTAPDQGFRLTLRLIAGGTLLSAIFLILLAVALYALIRPPTEHQPAFLQNLVFIIWLGVKLTIGVGLWFGGLDLLYHAILRLWLHWEVGLPIRLVTFLDDAVLHLYLRRVGHGYIFTHQLLLNHFAKLSDD